MRDHLAVREEAKRRLALLDASGEGESVSADNLRRIIRSAVPDTLTNRLRGTACACWGHASRVHDNPNCVYLLPES